MSRFATIDGSVGNPHAALVWEETEDGFRVVERLSSADEIPDDVDVYRFDVVTTVGVGVPGNRGNYPVVDVNGSPLWVGARIRFCVPSHYINVNTGEGEFLGVDFTGGTEFRSDRPMNVYFRGAVVEARLQHYAPVSTFQFSGPLVGYRVLSAKLGDPYEHGQTTTHFTLTDDPRSVCSPVPKLSAGPRR